MIEHTYKILADGIVSIRGSAEGPTIGVISNTHGNEPCGRRALQRILKKHSIKRGQLVMILGNPEATLLNRRYVETDMNRVFADEKLASNSQLQDMRRARYLVNSIPDLNLNLAIDFHSVSSQTPYPFTVAFPGTESLARLCPNPLVFGWKGIVEGTLCEWMCEHDVPTIVVEAGLHEAEAAVEHAEKTLLSVLSHHGLIKLDAPFDLQQQPEYNVIENVQIRDSQTFKLSREYGSFDKLEAGEIIARDKSHSYHVPEEEGYTILMPTTMENVRNGTASGAYYLMRKRS